MVILECIRRMMLPRETCTTSWKDFVIDPFNPLRTYVVVLVSLVEAKDSMEMTSSVFLLQC